MELEADRVYRTTYMFSATMPPAVERLAVPVCCGCNHRQGGQGRRERDSNDPPD